MGQEKLGVVDEAAIKAVGFYGGGVARSGNTCGVLLGAVAALSSRYSRGNLDGKEDRAGWVMADEFVTKFEELTDEYGGVECRDIARVDWTDPEAAKQFRTDPNSRRRLCERLVGDAAQALGELIDAKAARA